MLREVNYSITSRNSMEWINVPERADICFMKYHQYWYGVTMDMSPPAAPSRAKLWLLEVEELWWRIFRACSHFRRASSKSSIPENKNVLLSCFCSLGTREKSQAAWYVCDLRSRFKIVHFTGLRNCLNKTLHPQLKAWQKYNDQNFSNSGEAPERLNMLQLFININMFLIATKTNDTLPFVNTNPLNKDCLR